MKKTRKDFSILFALWILLTLSGCDIFMTTEANSTDGSPASASRHYLNYSIDDVQQIVNMGGQIYKDIRVYDEYYNITTYQVPVTEYEIERFLDIQSRNVQSSRSMSTRSSPFPVTQIKDSGLLHEDSIVIIILGDAFTEDQYGVWPDPDQGTVLYHANDVINTMLDTHPFGLFEHLLSVYVIHSSDPNQVAGVNGYLNTVDANGYLPQGAANQTLIAELASNLVDDPNYIDMIQVISNSTTRNGYAFPEPPGLFPVRIAVASIIRDGNPPGGSCTCSDPHCDLIADGKLWHNIFIHEFGHSFGNLSDERLNVFTNGEQKANATQEANNANVKWRHWYGYRNVRNPPIRFVSIGWAIPTGEGCLMRGGGRGVQHIYPDFCGVCTAQLVRQMAHVSGEIVHGRGPATNHFPNTPTVTMPQGATRILDSAFHGNTSLQAITIPSTVTSIGDYAFIGATGLQTITNQSTTPQPINTTTFAGLNRANITINIPAGTTQSYINAGWTGFILNPTPINISTVQHLIDISLNPYEHYLMTKNIDLSGHDWEPIPEFHGILDGNGYTINNLFCNFADYELGMEEKHYGLVAENHGIIRNLTIEADITRWIIMSVEAYVGVFAAINYGTILNCTAITSSFYEMVYMDTFPKGIRPSLNMVAYIGGIVGYNEAGGTVSNCHSEGNFAAWLNYGGFVGGIVGFNDGIVHADCTSDGIIDYGDGWGNYFSYSHIVGAGNCPCPDCDGRSGRGSDNGRSIGIVEKPAQLHMLNGRDLSDPDTRYWLTRNGFFAR